MAGMQFIASFMALSIAGIADSSYLIWRHYRKSKMPLVCPLNHDCSKVTESKWSRIFFVRNEILGLMFYISMFAAAIVLSTAPEASAQIRLLLLIGTGGALLFSAFLMSVQAFIIKEYCFYCIISAIISLLLFINSLLILF